MIYAEDLLRIVMLLVFAVLAINLSLVAFVITRRVLRTRFYARKDAARAALSPIVAAALRETDDTRAQRSLEKFRRTAERAALQDLLLAAAEEHPSRVTQLLVDLGYVRLWARKAFGAKRAKQLLMHISDDAPLPEVTRNRSRVLQAIRDTRLFAVERAVAVSYLGKLQPDVAEVFLTEAITDRSTYVARVVIAAIGRLGDVGIPLLVSELRKAAVEETSFSIRSVKTALVRTSIAGFEHFLPLLVHENARLRFLAIDTMREICGRETQVDAIPIPENVRQAVLRYSIADSSADVRARSAGVVRYFREARAVAALERLLQDSNEFVRLHAVRACADPYYVCLLDQVVVLVSDLRWRVREAAVRTLTAHQEAGLEKLSQYFLSTSDRYACEQIVEEMQRTGTVDAIVRSLGREQGSATAEAVCAKLVRLDKVSLLVDALKGNHPVETRQALLQVVSQSQRPQVIAALQEIAAASDDPLRQQAESVLSKAQAAAAAAAAAQGRA